MFRSMVDIQSVAAEIRRGKKDRKIEEERNHRAKNIMACPITYGGHNYSVEDPIMLMCFDNVSECGTSQVI